MLNLRFWLINFAVITLFGCVSNTDLRNNAENYLRDDGFKPEIIQTQNFKIFTLQKITDNTKPLRVYIEGDGHAFLTRSEVSPDPTPLTNTVIKLIHEDKAANIIYLARPCQYGMQDKNCSEKYWTTGRFAPEVIESEDEVLQKFKNNKLALIGYSGGAEIAIMLASKNPNVISIRTIAGNLDHKAFTTLRNETPLSDSVDPDAAIRADSQIPQLHFIGENDDVITPAIADSYKKKQNKNSCTRFYTIDGVTHSSGWVEQWPDLMRFQPECYH